MGTDADQQFCSLVCDAFHCVRYPRLDNKKKEQNMT